MGKQWNQSVVYTVVSITSSGIYSLDNRQQILTGKQLFLNGSYASYQELEYREGECLMQYSAVTGVVKGFLPIKGLCTYSRPDTNRITDANAMSTS